MGIRGAFGAQAAMVAVCASFAFGAAAQEQATGPSRSAGQAVEEITVTAEKTEKSLQETALSVQAFGVRDVEKLGLSRAEDVGKFTPGFVSLPGASGPSATTFTGRGVGERDFASGLPQTVGMYVDGMYIGTGIGVNFSLLDIERFEVLKGPQGTLFGRNTIGGAVSVTTVRPQPELGGSVKLGLGTYEERSFRGMLNVPLIEETLLGRVSVLRNRRDPFWKNKNAVSNNDYDDNDEAAARLALRWLATDTLTVDWSFERIEIDNKGAAAALTQVDPAFQASVLAVTGVDLNQYLRRDAGDLNTNDPHWIHVNTWQNLVTLTWDAGENTTIKSISGWRKFRFNAANDMDGTPLRIYRAGDTGSKERNFYQELQATGYLFDNRLEYALGATWFEEEAISRNYQGFQEVILFGLGNQVTKRWFDSFAWGIYGQTTLHATDRLHLTAGLRYSKERKETVRGYCGFRVTGPGGPPFFFTWTNPDFDLPFEQCEAGGGAYADLDPTTPGNLSKERFRSDNWSPLFRVAYDWTDEMMTYLSWTRGYRSGGHNIRYGSNPAGMLPYDDETVSQWETGIKSRWFDNRLQFNGSAYYAQFRDMQLSNWVSDPSGSYTVRGNAGRARIRGWELEAIAVPLEGLEVRLSHAWTNAEFSDLKECVPGAPSPCTPINRASFYRVAVSPKRTYTGSISYIFPESEIGTFEISSNFQRVSPMGFLSEVAQWHHTANSTYTVYGARAALYDAFGIMGLQLSLTGTNITDRSYVSNGITFGTVLRAGHTYNSFGYPRHFVFEVGYEF
jgi:iron complex outermembrane receptor protein